MAPNRRVGAATPPQQVYSAQQGAPMQQPMAAAAGAAANRAYQATAAMAGSAAAPELPPTPVQQAAAGLAPSGAGPADQPQYLPRTLFMGLPVITRCQALCSGALLAQDAAPAARLLLQPMACRPRSHHRSTAPRGPSSPAAPANPLHLPTRTAARRTSGKRLGYVHQLYVDPATLSVVSLYLRKASSSLTGLAEGSRPSEMDRLMLGSLREIGDVALVHNSDVRACMTCRQDAALRGLQLKSPVAVPRFPCRCLARCCRR